MHDGRLWKITAQDLRMEFFAGAAGSARSARSQPIADREQQKIFGFRNQERVPTGVCVWPTDGRAHSLDRAISYVQIIFTLYFNSLIYLEKSWNSSIFTKHSLL